MEDVNGTLKVMSAKQDMVKPSTIWLLFLFFGWSYGSLGQVGKQILFYLTFGGFGIWAFIRLFTLSGAIKDYNSRIATIHNLTAAERLEAGIY